jgi:hypothetical protein
MIYELVQAAPTYYARDRFCLAPPLVPAEVLAAAR